MDVSSNIRKPTLKLPYFVPVNTITVSFNYSNHPLGFYDSAKRGKKEHFQKYLIYFILL